MAGSLSLVIRIGDSKQINMTFRNAAGSYINITGRTYVAQIRRTADDPNVMAQFTCQIANGAQGLLVLSLTAEQTAALRAGSAKWDLQESYGSVTNTIFKGTVAIEQDVTRP
jgi:hypothetical protein